MANKYCTIRNEFTLISYRNIRNMNMTSLLYEYHYQYRYPVCVSGMSNMLKLARHSGPPGPLSKLAGLFLYGI